MLLTILLPACSHIGVSLNPAVESVVGDVTEALAADPPAVGQSDRLDQIELARYERQAMQHTRQLRSLHRPSSENPSLSIDNILSGCWPNLSATTLVSGRMAIAEARATP